MTLQVQVSSRAERDVDIIFDWLAQRSREGAVRCYHAFLDTFDSLPTEAVGYGTSPEAEKLGIDLRQALFKTPHGRKYRALFVINGKMIHVVGVRGAGQDLADARDLEIPEKS